MHTLNRARRQYPRIYALLKRCGHSPIKAFEILLEAKRGKRFAMDWIKCLRANG